MKVAINGFGRIGRSILKIALEQKIDIAIINDLHGASDAAYFLKYDSVFRNYPGKIEAKGDELIVNGKRIKVISEKDPEKLPWKKMNIDTVIESTGIFDDKIGMMKHIKAGAKRVVVTAPSKDAEITIVPGVNHNSLKSSHKFISIASCTTNASAPILKVLDDNFVIEKAFLSTIHAYTATQALVDTSNTKRRRGRAAGLNIVPSTTGASDAVTQVMPGLKGKLNGIAFRVPVPDGSAIDLTAELKKPFDVKKVNETLKKSSEKEMKGVIGYSEEELVSSDVIGDSHSTVIDSLLTQKLGNAIKIVSWYDNEHGYSCRVVDVIKMMSKFK